MQKNKAENNRQTVSIKNVQCLLGKNKTGSEGKCT